MLVENLSVLGGGAECGIKMITDFNSTLTKDETEKHHLLLVVEAIIASLTPEFALTSA